ncbi:MAG TPA: hypothetical protein VH592_02540, partial [Gemmataceae bacterium]
PRTQRSGVSGGQTTAYSAALRARLGSFPFVPTLRVGTSTILPLFAWSYLYQTAVIQRKEMMLPPTILTTEATLNPRDTAFIDHPDTQGTATSE